MKLAHGPHSGTAQETRAHDVERPVHAAAHTRPPLGSVPGDAGTGPRRPAVVRATGRVRRPLAAAGGRRFRRAKSWDGTNLQLQHVIGSVSSHSSPWISIDLQGSPFRFDAKDEKTKPSFILSWSPTPFDVSCGKISRLINNSSVARITPLA